MRCCNSAFRSNTNSSVTDSLLSERQRIDSSHRMTDEVLGFVSLFSFSLCTTGVTDFDCGGINRQAYATRAEFGRQSSNLQGISGRINGVICSSRLLSSSSPSSLLSHLHYATLTLYCTNDKTAQVPAINSVLNMISSRRNRDAVIMGSVVGGCSLVLLWFVFG